VAVEKSELGHVVGNLNRTLERSFYLCHIPWDQRSGRLRAAGKMREDDLAHARLM
jgi:hypothetical protein